MCQTKESNKREPGWVVIYIQVHLVLIYNITCSKVLLVLVLNFMVHKSSYCKCSLAWCQARTFLLFTIWTHPLQVRQYPLRYAGTDRIKKSHYNNLLIIQKLLSLVWEVFSYGIRHIALGFTVVTLMFHRITMICRIPFETVSVSFLSSDSVWSSLFTTGFILLIAIVYSYTLNSNFVISKTWNCF